MAWWQCALIAVAAVLALTLALVLLSLKNGLTVRLSASKNHIDAALKLTLLTGLVRVRVRYRVEWSEAGVNVKYSYPFHRAEKSLADYIAEQKNKKKNKKGKSKTTRLVRTVLLGATVEQLALKARLGTKDAAECAVLCGSVSAAAYGLFSRFRYSNSAWPQVDITPVFNDSHFSLDFTCIANVSAVQIITEKRRGAKAALRG